jgi:glycosyltransferase involved in cell wall biosynthesis
MADNDSRYILIGIPILNEEKRIGKLLKSLLELSYPRDHVRILFVDGGSTDQTLAIIAEFARTGKRSFDNIMLLEGNGWNLAKSRNKCIESLRPGEYLWFLDSDVYPTPNALRLLVDMMKKYDIASLYYTRDPRIEPHRKTNPVWAVRMGCTLLSPYAISVSGLFNERIGNWSPEDAAYSITAFNRGAEIGYDIDHVQIHDFEEPIHGWSDTLTILWKKRGHLGWWFPRNIASKAQLVYLVVLISVILIPFSVWFAIVPLAYFLIQIARKRNLGLAFASTLKAIIFIPLTIFAYLELRRNGGAFGPDFKGHQEAAKLRVSQQITGS